MESEMLVISGAGLAGIAIVAVTVLLGWKGWLALKLRELEKSHLREPAAMDIAGSPETVARIEIASLRERIRRLEAIASGVDL